MSNYEIKFAAEEIPQPGACRSLMENGVWIERPADAERYEKPRPIVEAKPDFLCVQSYLDCPPAQRRPPVKTKPGSGRPKKPAPVKAAPKTTHKRGGRLKRITITAEAIAERLATMKLVDLAKEVGCVPSHLYRILQRAGIDEFPKLCERCGVPTKRTRKCRYCAPCSVYADSAGARRIRRQEIRAGMTAPRKMTEEQRAAKRKRNQEWRDRQAKTPCSVPGCGMGQYAHGLCMKHESRRRRGTLEVEGGA